MTRRQTKKFFESEKILYKKHFYLARQKHLNPITKIKEQLLQLKILTNFYFYVL